MAAFYGLYAANGIAVYNNWEKVEKSRKYLRACQIKKFSNFMDAQEYVVNNFLAFNSSNLAEVLPKTLPLNYVIFCRQLCENYDKLHFKREIQGGN